MRPATVGVVDEEREEPGRAGDEGAGERTEQMEDRSRRMERRSSELEREIGEAREDWQSKKSGSSAPGAQTEEGGSDLVDESEEPADFDLSGEQGDEESEEERGEEESEEGEGSSEQEGTGRADEEGR